MRLEQLQAFVIVAETGSFQQAAQRCGVTQSTVSRQVQSLESDLGVQLFHRQSSAKLTLAGERFLPRARKICLEWQNATQELQDLMAGKQPELCVAAMPSICAYKLPPVLEKFCQTYPDVQLRVTALGSDRAIKVLKDGLVDLAIVMHNRFLSASPEAVVDVLYEEPIEILMAAEHPLARYAIVPWQELAGYPQVCFKEGYAIQRLVQDHFHLQGMELRAPLELNSLDAFRGVVRQGEWVALLPQTALDGAHKDVTLAVRRTEVPVLARQVVLVTTSDRLAIPPIRQFRALACDLMRPWKEEGARCEI